MHVGMGLKDVMQMHSEQQMMEIAKQQGKLMSQTLVMKKPVPNGGGSPRISGSAPGFSKGGGTSKNTG